MLVDETISVLGLGVCGTFIVFVFHGTREYISLKPGQCT